MKRVLQYVDHADYTGPTCQHEPRRHHTRSGIDLPSKSYIVKWESIICPMICENVLTNGAPQPKNYPTIALS